MWKLEKQLSEQAGRLYFDGNSVSDLAERFSTPLYAYSEAGIRSNYRKLHGAFSGHYKKFRIFYAVKANNNPAVLRILQQEGAGADCSSPSEIMLARMAGFSVRDMLYTGNYNSNDEFRYAIEAGATLNLDDISHVQRVSGIKAQEELCFRINPGMGSSGEEKLVFAGPDAKFGISAERAAEAYALAKGLGTRRFGIHMMTGSNILDGQYFPEITARLLDIAGSIAENAGIAFSFVNIGGGFGIPYKPGEEELDINRVASSIVSVFKEKCSEHRLGEPELRIEPGRYLVGDAGILIAKVTTIKEASKRFIGCDAGMNTLLRPALYGAYHHIFVEGKADSSNAALGQHRGQLSYYNICGQVCENTDQFAKDRQLPGDVKEGDLLVMLNAGAYGFGMSSQYNSRPRAAEVLCSSGSAELIRERESTLDLISKVHMPSHLISDSGSRQEQII